MAGMNKCIFIGNVGRKPELKTSKSGKSYCNFSIAVNEKKDGEPLWINVYCFEKQAESCAKYLDKGKQVCVIGRLVIEQYEKDGEKKTSVKVNASEVQFLGGSAPASQAPEPDEATGSVPF
jgi:single-strand DNA-binding protein